MYICKIISSPGLMHCHSFTLQQNVTRILLKLHETCIPKKVKGSHQRSQTEYIDRLPGCLSAGFSIQRCRARGCTVYVFVCLSVGKSLLEKHPCASATASMSTNVSAGDGGRKRSLLWLYSEFNSSIDKTVCQVDGCKWQCSGKNPSFLPQESFAKEALIGSAQRI